MIKEESVSYNDDLLFTAAEFFKVLGDSTRIKIVSLLFEQGELCVGDIVDQVQVSRTAVSHQLRVLKDNRIISNRKDGQMKYYRLDDHHIEDIVRLSIIHLQHQ
ncbi:metalloregulator ArsR/SmtB family transcription factor [Eubacteriaceae bacterium ES3]|nr:metalloregulator ArsR/SmtB family transcription factor [Eubacteriaceae bacterium ES3]